MLIRIKQLRKLVNEIYQQNEFDKVSVDVDWYEEDSDDDLSHLPSHVRVPEYLVDKLKETQSPGAAQEIENYILKVAFRDKWNDPKWNRRFSWDFSPESGLGLHGLEVLDMRESEIINSSLLEMTIDKIFKPKVVGSDACPDCKGTGKYIGIFSTGASDCDTCGGTGKKQQNVDSDGDVYYHNPIILLRMSPEKVTALFFDGDYSPIEFDEILDSGKDPDYEIELSISNRSVDHDFSPYDGYFWELASKWHSSHVYDDSYFDKIVTIDEFRQKLSGYTNQVK